MTSSRKTQDTDIFRAALKVAMAKYGLNQPQLSKRVGISSGGISDYLSGKTDPGFTKIEKIATGLGLTVAQFFALGDEKEPSEAPDRPSLTLIQPSRLAQLPEDDIDPEGFIRVPLAEDMRLAAGSGGAVANTYEATESPVVVYGRALGRRSNHLLQAFRVGGDSMEPVIAKRGLVIADLAQNDLGNLREGAIYVICWDVHDGECAVKYLSWAREGELLAIGSEDYRNNPPVYREVDEVRLIGRVIWSWREH